MPDTVRPAPRVAASSTSLAAAYAALNSPRPSIRARVRAAVSSLAASARALLKAVEPDFDFGPAGILSLDDVSGDGRQITVDWFGMHVTIFYGRRPRAPFVDEERAAWAR